MEERWQTIRSIWRDWHITYDLSLGIILIAAGVWVGSLVFAADGGYETNLYTEALGVLVTVLILNRIAHQRETRRLKKQLVREARSRDNSTAISAIDWMREEGWLQGEAGLLRGVDLSGAHLEQADFGLNANLTGTNLQNANLSCAKLEAANLTNANLDNALLIDARLQQAQLICASLKEANLTGVQLEKSNLTSTNLKKANLQNADLQHSNLTGAGLEAANLTKANLRRAIFINADLREVKLTGANLGLVNFTDSHLLLTDLTEADLRFANLSRADLWQANLLNAYLRGAKFYNTIPPNAKLMKQRSGERIYDKDRSIIIDDIYMKRFSNPEHPKFWQPSQIRHKNSGSG